MVSSFQIYLGQFERVCRNYFDLESLNELFELSFSYKHFLGNLNKSIICFKFFNKEIFRMFGSILISDLNVVKGKAIKFQVHLELYLGKSKG